MVIIKRSCRKAAVYFLHLLLSGQQLPLRAPNPNHFPFTLRRDGLDCSIHSAIIVACSSLLGTCSHVQSGLLATAAGHTCWPDEDPARNA